MVRFNSAGRIQPTEYRNLLQPGQCALCNRIGRSPDEVFANFGVELEYYGILYLCQDCCNEVVNFMEAVPKETYDVYKMSVADLKQTLDEALKQNTYLRGLLNVRIESAGTDVINSNGFTGVFVPELEQAAAEVDRIVNKYKSEPT